MDPDERELEYYRNVEDLFASLRGTPHVLSPKDFQLLRGWWRDQVPLAAVVTGLTEVFTRIRENGEKDPVVSLSYCRHAVKRHAARLARMQVGASEQPEGAAPVGDPDQIEKLVGRLTDAADHHRQELPAVAEAVMRAADQIRLAGEELPAELLDEHLFTLETSLLEDCRKALPDRRRKKIDDRVEELVAATSATDEARERSARALRDRETRTVLGLPRLELEP
jgi:hypothetical protein